MRPKLRKLVLAAACVFASFAAAEAATRSEIIAEYDQEFTKNPMLQALKRNFRREYDAALEEIATLHLRQDFEGIRKVTQSLSASIAVEYGSLVRFAPDKDLIAWLNASRTLTERLLDVAGPRICWNVFAGHPDYLPYAAERFLPELSEKGRATLDAMGAARATPVTRSEPSEADWTAFREAFVSRGGRLEDLAKTEAVVTMNETTCPTLAVLYRTLAELEGEVGKRVRGGAVPVLIVNSANPPR